MEKRTAHCKLAVVHALVRAGQVQATAAAFQGARAIGIEDLDGICSVVLRLTPDDFHKSMTTHMDHRIWQDVYHVRLAAGVWAYVKLTVVDEVLVVSFKEL